MFRHFLRKKRVRKTFPVEDIGGDNTSGENRDTCTYTEEQRSGYKYMQLHQFTPAWPFYLVIFLFLNYSLWTSKNSKPFQKYSNWRMYFFFSDLSSNSLLPIVYIMFCTRNMNKMVQQKNMSVLWKRDIFLLWNLPARLYKFRLLWVVSHQTVAKPLV